MKNLDHLKSALEKTCKIASWNPTPSQLETIAIKLARSNPISPNDVSTIVKSICSSATFMLTEGIDNSDIRTLLSIAIQIANSKS